MIELSSFEALFPIIYPTFFCQTDSAGNELVFLDLGQERCIAQLVHDKTQYEAFENHFHIFGKVKKADQASVREIGVRIAQNLVSSLKRNFPQKSFVVFLTIDFEDSTIIRFHQVWDNEPFYYDLQKFDYGETEILEFTV